MSASRWHGVQCYLTRFHVASADIPNDVVGLVYFSSSAVSIVITRFWSPPTRFGNTMPSTCVVIAVDLVRHGFANARSAGLRGAPRAMPRYM